MTGDAAVDIELITEDSSSLGLLLVTTGGGVTSGTEVDVVVAEETDTVGTGTVGTDTVAEEIEVVGLGMARICFPFRFSGVDAAP